MDGRIDGRTYRAEFIGLLSRAMGLGFLISFLLVNFFYPKKPLLLRIFNACNQEQFQKNLINKFREKFKLVNFDPKIIHLHQLWQDQNFF